MTDDTALLRDPEFQSLLSRRSRWRWGLSGFLICTYFVYALGGLYFSEFYARPIGASSIPRGIVFGLLIIAMSVVLSLVYIRVVNSLQIFAPGDKEVDR